MKKLFTFLLVGVFGLSLSAQSNITITSSCDDNTICNTSTDCSNMFVELTASATTDCSMSSDLTFSYEIDLFDDGSIDFSGALATANGDFPQGAHRIIFTISDQCNTSEVCDYLFEIKDCAPPVPVCIFGIATTVMPPSGMVTIYAEDFESGSSFDNCTAYDDLHFSFSQDINHDSIVIACSDIPADGLYPITLYVTDEANNYDSCSSFINVQDPIGACPGNPVSFIEAVNVNGESIENVIYDVNGTLHQGSTLPLSYLNIGDVITPIKNENHLNGVTVYDLVLIDKHILNIQTFDEPWKLLAADVNESNSITTLDKAIIKSVILYINTAFPSGKSWIFDPTSITYDGNLGPINFSGIKLGDVNGTASPMFQSGNIDVRAFDGTLNLFTKNQILKAGKTYTISTFSNNFEQVIGGQFTIDFDPTALEFQKIKGNNSINFDENSFGKTMVDDGFVLCGWNTSISKNLKQDDSFFEITFTAKKNGKLSDFLTINSKKLAAEIYIENRNDFEFWNAELTFKNEENQNEFSIAPNPFSEKTTFNFSLENAGQAELEIFDTNGRLVFSQQKNMQAGKNQIEIQKANLPTNGIYFYQLKTTNEINSGKFILF
ncbi:MAG: T9SS type A sorting domain-containing protein [Saprospiraceae bacterium]